MAMPAISSARRYTVAEVLAFPADGNRYEVVHGELLVTPAPRALHQCVAGQLYRRLGDYLDGLGRRATVWYSPADITWGDETAVQPDVFVVPPEDVSADWGTYKHLLLAVEVLSALQPTRRPGRQAAALPGAARRHVLDRGCGQAAGRGVAPGRRGAGDRDGRAAVAGRSGRTGAGDLAEGRVRGPAAVANA